jgi:hypothetical protein
MFRWIARHAAAAPQRTADLGHGGGLVTLVALLLANLATAAHPELVIFSTGEVLKVRHYEVGEELVKLELRSGGTLSVPLLRVDRILEDEVEEPTAAPLPSPSEVGTIALHFAAGSPAPATPWGAEILGAAQRHDLNPRLLAAVVAAESAFDSRAVSRKGARGLMQLMPSTGQRYGLSRSELFDPEKNLAAGARYLAWLLDRFAGDLPLALAAYNAGEQTVDRYGGVPPYRETRAYVKRIYGILGLEPTVTSGL